MFLHLLLRFGRHCRHAFSRVGRKYIFSAVLSASLERFEMALQRSKPFEFLHERGWGSDDDIHGLVTSRDFAFISSLHFVRDGFMKYLQKCLSLQIMDRLHENIFEPFEDLLIYPCPLLDIKVSIYIEKVQ
jgi:hypothetical protein